MERTGHKSDVQLTKRWIESSFDTLCWLKEIGVNFTSSASAEENSRYTPGNFGMILAKGGGLELTSVLFRKLESMPNAHIVYDCRVYDIIANDNSVSGVIASIGGANQIIKSKSIVLASGGFEANPELRRKFMGNEWMNAKGRGTKHNTGDLILASLKIGAQLYGDLDYCGSSIVDSRINEYQDPLTQESALRQCWNYGLIVNLNGQRFIDEGEDFPDRVLGLVGKAVLRETNDIAFQIFDQKTLKYLDRRYFTSTPVVADTYEDLAGKLGIEPASNLKITIESFNSTVTDNPYFNPEKKDGKSTLNISPPKSNWALKIDTPPFVAYPVSCGIAFTFAGLKVDSEGRVLGAGDKPINGLYAAGEITGGFFFQNHPVGSGLARGAVFGRISGLAAATYAKN